MRRGNSCQQGFQPSCGEGQGRRNRKERARSRQACTQEHAHKRAGGGEHGMGPRQTTLAGGGHGFGIWRLK